jgi:uncharacterized phage-associated protein
MTIHIEPSQLEKLLLYILNYLNRSVGSVELAKLVYLIDVEAIRLKGESITGQNYRRAPLGPLVADFEESRSWLDGNEIVVIEDEEAKSRGVRKHNISIGPKPRFQVNFSELDLAIINRVLNSLGSKSVSQLKKIAYDTEPWKLIEEYDKSHKSVFRGNLDLNSIKRNHLFKKWEESKEENVILDPKYQELLSKEKAEVEALLSAIS